jgi:ElaB/YqjD/DUF883 family membrane-anchored ribosome-binding protein
MKKVKLTLSLALIAGLLAIIPASAQVEASPEGGTSGTGNLQLLITINRMELSPTQMQEIHDILAGVLSEADTLKADRDAFTQEMLEFNGSTDELDAMLETFQEQMKDKTASVRESMQGALDEIKGILTIKQGEILSESLMPMRGGEFSTRMQGQTPYQQDMRRMREFLANHPEIRERAMERFGTMNQETQRPFGQRGEQPLQQGGQPGVDHPLLAQRLADKGLATLQQIVDILEAKLQYIQ